MENRAHCKHIADDIEAIVDGKLYRCPECGEWIEWNNDQYNDESATYTCQECGAAFDESNLEVVSFYDYFENALDINYITNSQKEYKACRIMVACGGPNIFVDTQAKEVQLYWWSDRASYPISAEAADAINEDFEMLYNC